jgi:tRNA 2-thiouridine synthesizing protein A
MDNPPLADIVLDAGETACGDLVMQIFQQMKALQPSQVLEVIAYDPGAREDIPAWCRQTGNTLLSVDLQTEQPVPIRFLIQKKP